MDADSPGSPPALGTPGRKGVSSRTLSRPSAPVAVSRRRRARGRGCGSIFADDRSRSGGKRRPRIPRLPRADLELRDIYRAIFVLVLVKPVLAPARIIEPYAVAASRGVAATSSPTSRPLSGLLPNGVEVELGRGQKRSDYVSGRRTFRRLRLPRSVARPVFVKLTRREVSGKGAALALSRTHDGLQEPGRCRGAWTRFGVRLVLGVSGFVLWFGCPVAGIGANRA